MRLQDLADTSALVRIALPRKADGNATKDRGSLLGKAQKPVKSIIACEPVVSVLSEVARLLQPGRCVT